ncbi:zinc finger protein 501-like [Candoia aspera]|uniref:zinc finger protein 501-like n=1 Tax=Candoia aspera TaxID=51853 RepID=UPI002FD7C002
MPGRCPALSHLLPTGHLATKPELICKIEREEQPWVAEPVESPTWRRPQSPWLGDGIRVAEDEEGEAGSPVRQCPPRCKRGRKARLPRAEKPGKQARPLLPEAKGGGPLRVTLKMNPPKCPECSKSFLSNVAMTIHIRTHTGERPFKCHLCPKGFPSRGDLKRHIRTHLHRKDPPSQGTPPKSRKCLTAKLQLLHQLGASPGPKGPHGCAQCGKSFSKRQDLRKHQGTHSGERPFACLECGRSFRLKQILVAHLKVHVGERPFACAQCGKRFSQKHHVESHQRVHTGEKPFACTTCGKRYAQKQPLISHLRVHTGERPFSCPDCGKAFRNRATLTIHQRMHSGERPYRCLLCGKACSQLQHLKSHQRVHRGEQHLLAAGDSKALALKKAREVVEKPHQCPGCEKRFRDAEIMRAHLRTHEERKGLRCGASPKPGPALPAQPKKPPPESTSASRGAGRKPPALAQSSTPARKRAFACAECSRRFTQAKYLTLHQRSHR